MSTTPNRIQQASPLTQLRAVTAHRLRVGEHVVDLGSLRVVSAAECPKLTPKAASVLLELVQHAGRTVTHDDLLDRVWAGTCPTRNVLTQAIKELRRALHDREGQSCIETIPKIGYRLTVPAALLEPEAPPADETPADAAVGPSLSGAPVLERLGDAFAAVHALRASVLVVAILVLLAMLAGSPSEPM
jgi:DNA-binding winged helix-turn-helix (wHTH) protein